MDNDRQLNARQAARIGVASRQGWRCWVCAVPMVNGLDCFDERVFYCRGRRHLDITAQMPRFIGGGGIPGSRLGLGNAHAATLTMGNGEIHAAHLSCVCAFQALHVRHGRSVESALAELRSRLPERATDELHDDHAEPVDNQEKAQLESATDDRSKAQLPGCTTPELHHSTDKHVSRTSGSNYLPRVTIRLTADQVAELQRGKSITIGLDQ